MLGIETFVGEKGEGEFWSTVMQTATLALLAETQWWVALALGVGSSRLRGSGG